MNPFAWPVRIYYEDTDAGGLVYHANYLKFFERARSEWLRERGIELNTLASTEGIIFAVRTVAVDFIRPARFNQRLMVEVGISDASRVAVQFAQRILLQNGDSLEGGVADDTLLCSADINVVTLDAMTMRPKRMPNFIFAEIMRGHGC